MRAPSRVVVCAVVAIILGCGRNGSTLTPAGDTEVQGAIGHVLSSVPKDEGLVKPEYTKTLAKSLRKLNLADPTADLEYNLSRGNSRFVGIYGYACSPPGLDQSGNGTAFTDDQLLQIAKGVDCIAGTSDVIPNDTQYRDLYETAWHYAEIYNKELLRRVRSGAVK